MMHPKFSFPVVASAAATAAVIVENELEEFEELEEHHRLEK